MVFEQELCRLQSCIMVSKEWIQFQARKKSPKPPDASLSLDFLAGKTQALERENFQMLSEIQGCYHHNRQHITVLK